ncbi:putative allantoinase 1 [Fusarium oxysporum f. sp. albedinis]|nr:putative allantoinase 1 [Fusarium oxysporum f. sp. albedinis]
MNKVALDWVVQAAVLSRSIQVRAQESTINILKSLNKRRKEKGHYSRLPKAIPNQITAREAPIPSSYPIAYCGVIWKPADLGRFAQDDNPNPSMSLQLHSFPRYSGDIPSMVISCKDDLMRSREKNKASLELE